MLFAPEHPLLTVVAKRAILFVARRVVVLARYSWPSSCRSLAANALRMQ